MLQSVYPVLCSSDLDRSIDFYRRLLDLDVVFECGWYATLRPRDGQSPQVGLVEAGHATLPAALAATPGGVLVSLVVDSVDAVHGRAADLGAEIVWPLCDEEFGQRHFMVLDRDGFVVDLIEPIAMSPAFPRQGVRWRREHRP
jgi:catechol 2,3-dioxygenase-like lactoylglutathione lyase family enzyme